MTNQSSMTQLIRLTLLDGDPEGLRAVSVAGRTTILMGCPWTKLQTLLSRPEARRPSVYLMIGTQIDSVLGEKDVVYIEECDSLVNRIEQHHKQEAADWIQIFAATTTEATFNKAHAGLAEHLLVSRAKDSGRVEVLTKSTAKGVLDEGDEAFTCEFVENVVILTQILGSLLFRPTLKIRTNLSLVAEAEGALTSSIEDDELPKFSFDYTKEKIDAEMITDGRDFVVLKGSEARADSPGISLKIQQIREQSRRNNELTKQQGHKFEVFQKDFPMTSVSAARTLVYGSACAGPLAWRHVRTGQLYKDWIEGAITSSKEKTILGD